MKKIISISLLTTIALYATNGDNLIGFGAKSRSMGGVGIATFVGADNAISNPALLSNIKDKEVNFNLMYFSPTIKTNGAKSDTEASFIPQISYAQKKNENISYGVAFYGAAGMGVDFVNSGIPSLAKAKSELSIMKFAPSISYKKDKISFGFSPIIQYGSLNLSYTNGGGPNGKGKSDDFGYGFKTGLTYDVTPAFRVGLVYQSSINMKYKDTITVAATGFGLSGFTDKLEQPAEIGIGFSYDINNFTLSADYKKVQWADANGYKDFGWSNQNIYAVGAKYENNGTWYALGYNYAKTPINENFGEPSVQARINSFNYIFFPATQERHYTIGAGKEITKDLSISLNLVYGAKNTHNITNGATGAINVSHSETSISTSLKYTF